MSLAEKNIVVLFNSIPFSDLSRRQAELRKGIEASAKSSKLFSASESILITILHAAIENETSAVLIMIPDEKKTDYGQQLYDFKQSVIQKLKGVGIILHNDDIRIDFRSGQYIEALISDVKIKEREKTIQRTGTPPNEDDEFNYESKAKQFVPAEPLYSFNRVILPHGIIKKIEQAIAILECENKVFNEWGLYEIQPHPSTSLSFFGPSGTGKTMAAEAVAEKLGKKILKVSYADVESKYHGEGPKMVKAIFLAAEKADAVLFFDEADSLLSKRLTNISHGSEQSINSMRSQLLICLEEFRGIVIFATNLVINYDKAFLTRLISIEFPVPDVETRVRIWDVHIKPTDDGKEHKLNIPLASDVDTGSLAEKYDFVGREIRNAVVSACVNAAMEGKNQLSQADFMNACDNIVKERDSLKNIKDHTVHDEGGQEALKAAILSKIKKEEDSR